METSTTYRLIVLSISMIVIVSSYVSICLKEKSWINWYTVPTFMTIAENYILPPIYWLANSARGSYFAFTYCYLTYAFASLAALLGYRIGRSLYPSTRCNKTYAHSYGTFPWVLLATGVLLYLPILIKFHALILTPREIYMNTRTGYGLYFFGSSMMMSLALITYLFKKKKSIVGGFFLCAICVALMYLHGSKGEILGLLDIFILYRVYILRRSVGIGAAMASLTAIALAVSISFALFGGLTDIGELVVSMSSYSDYTRNAILVIDDPAGRSYWGQLTLENEVYSRIPRVLMPDKPKDFGSFKLAKIYYPGSFQMDAGSPAFGLGVQYADFGVFAILLITSWSLLEGWIVAILVTSLRSRPEPGQFVVLLFFSGVGIIPLGAGYLLPETIGLAAILTFVYRHNLVLRSKRSSLALRPEE